MSASRKNLLAHIVWFFAFFFTNSYGEGIKLDLIDTEQIKEALPFLVEKIDLYQKFQERIKKGRALEFKKGDFEGYFGGMSRIEYYMYSHLSFLNHKIPDQLGVFKQTADLILDLIYGKNKYGHKAFEFYFDLRSKSKWGVLGAYRNTSSAEVKLENLSLGKHEHKSSRPIPWFKDIWMQFSFNSAFKLKSKNLHYLKLGWFPFQLGRGIALGSSYALIYEGLGAYSYIADSSAPGININGEILKDKLFYDLYYAKFEDKSDSVSNTYLNTARKNQLGREKRPWRGEAKDDDLVAARLKWTALNNSNNGKLEFEPYIFYNEASDQRIEFPDDSKLVLGSYGLMAEYKNGNFELGGDIAFNYGHEYLYGLDRNKIILKLYDNSNPIPQPDQILNDGRGAMYQAYNYVIYANSRNAPVNQYTTAAAAANKELAPGITYPNAGHGENLLTNKSGRIRPAHRINLRGWMGTIDTSYDFSKYNFKIALGLMFASGDTDPHDSKEEYNKTYHGFIGLHELYNGKRVKSALLAGEREIRKPLSLKYDRYEDPNYVDPNKAGYYAKVATTFTDLVSIGTGFTWYPKKLNFNSNVLLFWKDDDSAKYILDTNNVNNSHTSSADNKASKFLGTEFNIIFNYQLLRNLNFGGVFALFFPGTFFKDIKGVPFRYDYYRANLMGTGANPADYRISDDTAMFIDASLTYKF
ncbi:hypothetical protein GF322_00905 [Candidatus Dependentiae bacterium]|nr:hypothetical protein [Candidatus Dependentiae bacterium]